MRTFHTGGIASAGGDRRGSGLQDDGLAAGGFQRLRVGHQAQSGGGNPSFGAKWRFYENEASGSSLAVKPEVVFPVSAGRENSGLGTCLLYTSRCV